MNSTEVRELLNKEVLTVTEVSRVLRVSPATVPYMIGKGLEAVNIGKGKHAYWRIYSSSVKRLLGIDEQIPA